MEDRFAERHCFRHAFTGNVGGGLHGVQRAALLVHLLDRSIRGRGQRAGGSDALYILIRSLSTF